MASARNKRSAKRSSPGKPRVLAQGRYVRLLCKDNWEYIQRHNCSGIVVILALTEDNKVLLTRQYRLPVNGDVIEFPAGLMNDGASKRKEGVIAAARRELLEETGYAAKKITRIMAGPAGSGLSADILTIVRASGLKKIGDGGGDETENITVCEVPIANAEKWLNRMMRRGCHVDPKVYAGLYFLKFYNKNP